jgi:hypothetical protein
VACFGNNTLGGGEEEKETDRVDTAFMIGRLEKGHCARSASAERPHAFLHGLFIYRDLWCDRPRAEVVVNMHAETISE